MCLILFSYETHPSYRLVLLANRDEFYRRPTAGLGFWEDAPHVLAGRDLTAGGTWLALSTGGRLGAVTNYRHPSRRAADGPSRGSLVADFVTGGERPEDYLVEIAGRGELYDGYNLIVGDAGGLHYHSNRGGGVQPIEPGIYGLSNHLLNTPWPKVRRGVEKLRCLLSGNRAPELEDFFSLLSDATPFADADLPDTGVGRYWERLLSPLFIVSREHGYGTRSSSVILIDRDGQATFAERTTDPSGTDASSPGTRRFDLRVGCWGGQGSGFQVQG